MMPESYTLALTIHHIVSDGWSLGIFFRELGVIYQAFASGKPPALSAPACQFADYSCWQQNELSSGAFAADLAYWRQKLEGSPAMLDLPTDYPRPAVQGFAGAVHRFSFPGSTCDGLRKLSQQEGASDFMVLLTVFKVLLTRYTHQADISVGTPVVTRDRPELETLIGCFVNTMVLRTQFPAAITARDLLRSVRETVLEGHAHLHAPFEQVVKALQPDRSLSHSALFQVAFNFQNTPLSAEFETLSVSSMFDLNLFMWEGGDTFHGAFEYRTDLFTESTIARMTEHFSGLASGIAEHPDHPIAELRLLSESEIEQYRDLQNQTAIDYPRDRTVSELFEIQAGRTPHALAVTAVSKAGEAEVGVANSAGPPQRVTYQELDERSNRLARRLRSLGVQNETMVGVCLERSIDMVSALLGVLKAGGAYLPIDPDIPQERLRFIIEDAQPPVVICEAGFRGRVPANVVVISLPEDWGEIQKYDGLPLGSLASPENLAYVIFTSGSTGRPKGVQVTHRNVVNLLSSMRRQPGLAADDRLLSVTTISFDIAGLEIFLPLTTGASVVLASRVLAANGRELAQLLENCGATVMQATPATWQMLFDSGWRGRKSLRILCGGDSLPRDLADRLLSAGSEVWNLYGPTETTIWSTVFRVEPGEGRVSIGRPIGNTQVYVLDENRQLVPPGVAGELCIGGDGLARGYLNRPELTAEKYVTNPFVPTARLYRTGDLARWLPDGNLQFLGRSDHQLKIRGFRIELGEIEHLLRAHADIQDAVVAATTSDSGDVGLAGYIVPRYGGANIEVNGLRRYLAARLPEYMIPSSFTELRALPLTANGKVDRSALPSPVRVIEKTVEPRNPMEAQLLSLWEEVLGRRGFGIRDNFFDLGGHSLLALKFVAKMERVFGPFPVSLLFEAPTIEQMAARLSGSGAEGEWRRIIAVQPKGSRPPLFVTPGANGNILSFSKVVLGLDSNQPVYGFQFAGPGGEAPPDRVEELARQLVDEILKVQPAGPVYLAGICVGGTVAYEMARQLTEQGHEVAAVILVDAFPPESYRPSKLKSNSKVRAALAVVRSAVSRVGMFARIGIAEKAAYFRKVSGILYRMVFRLETPRAFRSAVLAAVVQDVNFLAISRYRPRPYSERVVIILRDDGDLQEHDARLDWLKFAGPDSEILRVVAPSHNSLFEPPWVDQIAAALRTALEPAKSTQDQLR